MFVQIANNNYYFLFSLLIVERLALKKILRIHLAKFELFLMKNNTEHYLFLQTKGRSFLHMVKDNQEVNQVQKGPVLSKQPVIFLPLV